MVDSPNHCELGLTIRLRILLAIPEKYENEARFSGPVGVGFRQCGKVLRRRILDLDGWDQEAYCRRIRLLRKLFDMNQTEFSAFVGIPYKKWNHYERGYPISRETAFILSKKIDWFSTDWLWHGDTRALSAVMLERITKLESERVKKPRIFKLGKPLQQTPVRTRISKKDRPQARRA